MKYLKLFILFPLLMGKVYAQEVSDTSYVLMPPISESCTNIIFTDSLYRAWNNASVENIKKTLLTMENADLETLLLQFTKGENYRLLFCKTLNNDSLITKEDFKKGFFIIEDIISGHALHIWDHLIVDSGDMLKGYYFKFNNMEISWDLRNEKTINKRKFHRLFNKIKKCKENEIMHPQQFIVTKFTEEKIESYVFAYEGCQKYINQFYDLIEKYKIEKSK